MSLVDKFLKKEEPKKEVCAGCGKPLDEKNVVGGGPSMLDGKKYHSSGCMKLRK